MLLWSTAVAVMALAAWAVARPLGIADGTHLPTCACGDVAQEAWWFALIETSLAHGHLALVTTRIDGPEGVSVLNNASFPLVAAVMAPVTAVLGPVASLVIALRAAFFLTGAVTFAVLRRITGGFVAPLAGALLYAFSPYMTHQAASHFFLVIGPLPPVILHLIHRHLTDGHPAGAGRPGRSAGLAVGALAVAQYLIDSEMLVMLAVLAVTVIAVVALARWVRRRPIRDHAHRLMVLGGWALAVAVPLLAYPAWETLAGAQHLAGTTQPLSAGGVDLRGTFFPADTGVLAGLWEPWRIAPQIFLGHNSYVGIPLAVVAVAVTVIERRRAVVRAAGLMTLVAWLLSLGPHLQLGSTTTSVPLPFDLLARIPVIDDVIPSRFAQFVDLGVAVLVAVGVAGLERSLRRSVSVRAVAAGAGIATGLALVAPVATYGASGTGPATEFRRPGPRATLGTGTALAYPYPEFPDDQAMLWQAEDGVRFALLGGYAIRPGAGRRSVRTPLVNAPSIVADTWLQAHADPASVAVGSTPWRAALQALPTLVRRRHLTVILVQTGIPGATPVAALVAARYGAPRVLPGVDVWAV